MAVGLSIAAIFVLFPELDPAISRLFYAGNGDFPVASWDSVRWVHRLVPAAGCAMFILASLRLFRAALGRPGVLRHCWRPASMLALTLALGVGAVVNLGLKEQVGRPRPSQVLAFGGPHAMVPVLQRSSACRRNCSFVSGHAATGFALMALGALGTPQRRRQWRTIGLWVGCLLGVLRIAQGGHFASDVLFAGLVIWSTTALMRAGWVRIAAARRGAK